MRFSYKQFAVACKSALVESKINFIFLPLATRESAAVQALAAAQILHSSITDCSYKGLCPKCKDRREVVPSHTKKAKGEEQLEEIIHQSGACEEMFPRPMDFIKRFLKIGKKKMQHLKKTWPEKRGHEEINFHNKQVGMQVMLNYFFYLRGEKYTFQGV